MNVGSRKTTNQIAPNKIMFRFFSFEIKIAAENKMSDKTPNTKEVSCITGITERLNGSRIFPMYWIIPGIFSTMEDVIEKKFFCAYSLRAESRIINQTANTRAHPIKKTFL